MGTVILIALGKYIAATAALIVVYLLLFRGKSSYNGCRFFLLLIPVAALLLSQFTIPVLPAETIEIIQSEETALYANTPITTDYKTAEYSAPKEHALSIAEPLSRIPNLPFVLMCVYLCVTTILLFFAGFGIYRIHRIKHAAEVIPGHEFDLVKVDNLNTSFTFLHSVFVDKTTADTKLEIILTHEAWHIRHRHYIDVILSELYVRTLWFNPLVWFIRKEIHRISEYQTDRSVLNEGLNIYRYQTTILEEVMGYNPLMTTGINNSFTKKRFIIMKKNPTIQFRLLRRIVLLPMLLVIFAGFSFTKAEPKIVSVATTPAIPVELQTDTTFRPSTTTENNALADPSQKEDQLTTLKLQTESEVITLTAESNSNDTSPRLRLTNSQGDKEYMVLRAEHPTDTLRRPVLQGRIVSAKENPQKPDTVIFKTEDNQLVKIPVISQNANEFFGSDNTRTGNLNPSLGAQIDRKYPEEDRRKIMNGYRIPDEHLPYAEPGIYNRLGIENIELTEKETIVTMILSAASSMYWFFVSNNTYLEDVKTKDRYMIRSAGEHIPLHKLIVIPNQQGVRFKLTLYFPRLKEKVKRINLIEYTDYKLVPRLGNNGGWRYYNLSINDFKGQEKINIYK